MSLELRPRADRRRCSGELQRLCTTCRWTCVVARDDDVDDCRRRRCVAVKALVKAEAGPGLWLQDVPEPKIEADEVLIKVLRTGLCGTDLHIQSWDHWAQKNVPVPMVTGHEFVGEVVEAGVGVRDVAVGDVVSGEGHLVCG